MKSFLQILVTVFILSFTTACYKSQPKAKADTQIQDVGGDQTDVFAIPFDSSEFEEKQEMNKLQSIGDRNKAKDADKKPVKKSPPVRKSDN